MARKDYSDLAFPEPWQILGIKLRPFSIGHYLKLRRLGCAFVHDDKATASIGDLILAVLVCAMPSDPDPSADEFWVWFNREKHDTFKGRIHRCSARLLHKEFLSPAEYDVYQLGRTIGVFDLAEKVAEFKSYMEGHTKSPDYFVLKEETANRAGAHWVHSMLATITTKCGYTLEQAYNLPFGQCLTDYLRLAEENGIIRFQTEEECAFLEASNGV